MKPSDDERLLDVREAATMLGLKPSTLYQWAYERRIPVVKLLGRALRFRLSTIRKLIAESERPALRALDDRSSGSV
jgi:excisionase family DNA binding protein